MALWGVATYVGMVVPNGVFEVAVVHVALVVDSVVGAVLDTSSN